MPNARALHAVQNTHAPSAFALPTESELKASVQRETANNERHKRLYYELVDELYSIVTNADRELCAISYCHGSKKKGDCCRHWRQEELASVMLVTLIRYDMHIPDYVAIKMFKVRTLTLTVAYKSPFADDRRRLTAPAQERFARVQLILED